MSECNDVDETAYGIVGKNRIIYRRILYFKKKRTDFMVFPSSPPSFMMKREAWLKIWGREDRGSWRIAPLFYPFPPQLNSKVEIILFPFTSSLRYWRKYAHSYSRIFPRTISFSDYYSLVESRWISLATALSMTALGMIDKRSPTTARPTPAPISVGPSNFIPATTRMRVKESSFSLAFSLPHVCASQGSCTLRFAIGGSIYAA